MPLRRRRHRGRRLAVVAFSLLTYLCSVAPAAATLIYCISDDGHAAFEFVAGGERGCASCCHDEPSEPAHEGAASGPVECTDITMSSDQALRATIAVDKDALSFTPSVVALLAPDVRLETPTFEAAHAALAPPRSSPAVFLRHTVLLI